MAEAGAQTGTLTTLRAEQNAGLQLTSSIDRQETWRVSVPRVPPSRLSDDIESVPIFSYQGKFAGEHECLPTNAQELSRLKTNLSRLTS
jgi:hypothetical protein